MPGEEPPRPGLFLLPQPRPWFASGTCSSSSRKPRPRRCCRRVRPAAQGALPAHNLNPDRFLEKGQNRLGWKSPLRSSRPGINQTLPSPVLNHISAGLRIAQNLSPALTGSFCPGKHVQAQRNWGLSPGDRGNPWGRTFCCPQAWAPAPSIPREFLPTLLTLVCPLRPGAAG